MSTSARPPRSRASGALLLGASLLAVVVLLATIAGAERQIASARGDRAALVAGVGAIGMTVSDLDRSIDFYSRVLGFRKVSETEVVGEAWEHGGMENFKKPPLSHPGLPWPHGRTFP